MSDQDTDLTFFTNGPNQTLLDRFKATLADTRLCDVRLPDCPESFGITCPRKTYRH